MRTRTLCAAIGLCLVISTATIIVRGKPASGQAKVGDRELIRSLAKRRLETSRAIYAQQVERQMANAEVVIRNFDDMSIWSKHWMEDEIRLDAAPAARVAAIQSHLVRMKVVEERMMNWAKVGQIRESDALKANYYRFEAEMMLAEAQNGRPLK